MLDDGTRRAPNGMVASVDHLASSAGIAMLRHGGSAADAAVAANAVVAVTQPHLCGLGGDLFALVSTGGAPAVLNASGRAGSGADPQRLRAEGHATMPFRGDVRSTTIPGCVDGWVALHRRFGRLPLDEVLEPAIGLAEAGFPASPLLALATNLLEGVPHVDELHPGRALRDGEPVRRPGVAAVLRAIASGGRAAFYEGAFGLALLEAGGGEFAARDLTAEQADWVDPLGLRLWGHDVWTVPPNSQGYLTLLGAAIAEGLELGDGADDDRRAHALVESARSAGHDRLDLLHEHARVRPLLHPEAVAGRRGLVDPGHRSLLRTSVARGGTMFLCAVDADRIGVSLIQSNASGFGSHVFVPGTGIGLQNRGIGFSLTAGHPAEYGPAKRPPHTLSPALVTDPTGALAAVIGTMGGDSQPQILLQLLARLLRDGDSPGTAIGAGRWVLQAAQSNGFDTWVDADRLRVVLEDTAPQSWEPALRSRGHDVAVVRSNPGFGHAHVIATSAGDMLAGAADPRAPGSACIGY